MEAQRIVSIVRAGTAHPCEDYVLVGRSQRVFAVADGVTRDDYAVCPVGEFRTSQGVARLLCENAIRAFEDVDQRAWDERAASEAFAEANRQIHGVNTRYHGQCADRLQSDDLLGTVGAMAALTTDGRLVGGYLGDCGVRIFDRNLVEAFRTVDQMEPVRRYLSQKWFRSDVERRTFVYTAMRNQRMAPVTGNMVGYGVLTGAEDALAFCSYFCHVIEPGSTIVLYSDGFAKLFGDGRMSEILAQLVSGGSGDEALADIVRLHDSKILESWEQPVDDMAAIFVVVGD